MNSPMTICYSVIPGDAIIFRLGDCLEGVGVIRAPIWSRLDCTDCVWMVPGTWREDNDRLRTYYAS